MGYSERKLTLGPYLYNF